MNKLKDKRAVHSMWEIVAGVILGIIVALLILRLITLIYASIIGEKEKEQAKQTLDSIKETINNLGDTPKYQSLVVPIGNYLIGFDDGVNSQNKDILSQAFCVDTKCLCICKPQKFLGVIQTSVDCRKNAECRVFLKPFKENGKDLYIKIPNNGIYINNEDSYFNVVRK